MPFNEESFNKYQQDMENSDHFYQNQSDDKKNKLKKPDLNQQVIQSGSNLSNIAGYATSSTASSNRELLANNYKSNSSYIILFLASLFEFVSFVAITITFIFPFWTLFSINITGGSKNVNITDTTNDVSLIISTLDVNPINFNMGIWEVRTNSANLKMVDLSTNFQITNNYSMLWLNSGADSFLVEYLSFIELSSSNIFIIQILEIIHLIFTALAFSSTAFTLCMCSKKRTGLCWYLICYFLCLISFLTGLAVIILIIVWQVSPLPALLVSQGFTITKSKLFSWCFWTAVGINASLFFASLLILCYIIIGSIMSYNKRKRMLDKQVKKHKIKTNNLSILKAQNNKNDMMSNNMTKIPRLQAHLNLDQSNSLNQSLNMSGSAPPFHNIQTLTNTNHNNATNNPSYTFYTGFGNYHKQNIRLNPIADDDNITERSYPVGNQSLKQAILNSNDHAYSNVFDQINQSFQSYH